MTLRRDEAEEMAMMEACGAIVRGTPEWDEYLKLYRGTLMATWLRFGGSAEDLAGLMLAPLRRVFYETMGYELPEEAS